MEPLLRELIARKPHLSGPLSFYEKTVRFMNAVSRSGAVADLNFHAYRPEHIDPVFRNFAPLFDLPEGALSPLKEALMAGEIDFTRLPLLEVPAFSLPYAEDDLTMLLFILSRPFFVSLRTAGRPLAHEEGKGACMICRGRPVLASGREGGGYKVWCSFCGCEGTSPRESCPVCHASGRGAIRLATFEQDKNVRIQSCDSCRSYVKVIDAAWLSRTGPDIADIASLPMDIVVQQRGFRRRAPNPLGMLRMSASG